jgi:DNA-binding FrmR family transcriptional regulator
MAENDECCHCASKHADQLIRLRKIEGQVKGIQKMINEDRYCIDILMQLKSIKNALIKVEENIMRRHIETCVTDAIKSGSEDKTNEKIVELMEVISKFSK